MGKTFCIVTGFTLTTLGINSITSLICIAVFRYLSIRHQVYNHKLLRYLEDSVSAIYCESFMLASSDTTEIPQQPKYSLLPHEQIYYVEYSNRSIPKL